MNKTCYMFVSDDNNVIAESFPENLNPSFLNDDSKVIDVSSCIVDHQTPIYAVSEMELTPINPISQENISTSKHSLLNLKFMSAIFYFFTKL